MEPEKIKFKRADTKNKSILYYGYRGNRRTYKIYRNDEGIIKAARKTTATAVYIMPIMSNYFKGWRMINYRESFTNPYDAIKFIIDRYFQHNTQERKHYGILQ